MGSAGLSLVQVDVSQHGLDKHSQASGSDRAAADWGEAISNDSDAPDAPVTPTKRLRHEGLFDDYA